jgi:hypothetical protein
MSGILAMGKADKDKLAGQKRAYRLWFEYLRVARLSTKKEIKSAITAYSGAYRDWHMDEATKFDSWWKDHSHLFEERYFVRPLGIGEEPLDSDALILEIPLTQSPTILTRKVRALIQEAYSLKAKQNKKSKTKATAQYKITDGVEPKFDAIREMLSIYRDVYLKNPTLKGRKLLDKVHQYYKSRKNQYKKVPSQFQHQGGDDEQRALRNLNRYIHKAEKIVLNVARGEFPGKY